MCLFSPNTDALTPLRSRATPDRAPDHLADGTPAALRDDLISLLGPTSVRSRVTDLVKYAFAGDRGLLHEELTRSATHDEASEVMQQDLDLYICANRTCEVGVWSTRPG